MKSVALHNLGCKVNSYEMDVMQQYLQNNGYKIVEFEQKADIYIINTCTVTNIADRKSRQMLHRAKKQNPDAIVVAVGCYVQTGLETVELDDCIDLAVGNNRKKDLIPILEEFLSRREKQADTSKTLDASSVIDINKENEYEEMQLQRTAEHTRAYIKIQDGCNQFCSYCIIPFARGRVRSRKPEQVVSEVKELAKNGYKEVVVTGIHLSSYGLDFYGQSYNQAYDLKNEMIENQPSREEMDRDFRTGANELLKLLSMLQNIDGITRIRLGSLEPRVITEEFAARLAELNKVCPHFHLSLQSGCDETLKRMNRQYSSKDFEKSVQILRKVYKDVAITTDVICGFPGETEQEFLETKTFLEKIKFFEMHIFPYSKRKGTVAAAMPGQLTEKEKKNRCSVFLEMDKQHSDEYRKSFIGQSQSVLFEQQIERDGEKYQIGHTVNYIKVVLKTDEDLAGEEVVCNLKEGFGEDALLGEKIF